MTSGDGKRRRLLSQEERVLWTAVTKSIAPLRDAVAPGIDDAADKGMPARARKHPVKTATTAPSLPEKKSPPPLVPLGRRMKQRVARGKDEIDGRLDLHG